jgi:cation:H+ antiporter
MIQSLPGPAWLLWAGALFVGLAILVKASDWFTDAAVRIGHAFGMPGFLIGATIIALGTSLPELVSSLVAVLQNAPEIVAGNVIGSNIANLLLVLGLTGVVTDRLRIAHDVLSVDLPFLLGSALFLSLIAWNGLITRGEALLALAGFAIFFGYALTRDTSDDEMKPGERVIEDVAENASTIVLAGSLIAAAALVYLSAHLTIEAVVAMAEIIGIGTETIAASAVALGTSLPEVAVTLTAVRQGRAELAIGNILGSNIFNSFAVIGVVGLIEPLMISAELIVFALPMMMVASVIAVLAIMEQELTNWEGWLLLLFYIFFLGSLFGFL